MQLEEVLKEFKYTARLTQCELAKAIGCEQASISRWKNGKQFPTLKTAQKIVNLAKQYKIKVKLEDLVPKE